MKSHRNIVRRVTIVTFDDKDDLVLVDLDAPTPYPNPTIHPEMKDDPPSFRMEVQQGYGAQWARNVFGVEPEIAPKQSRPEMGFIMGENELKAFLKS